jgi:hypothetical protein
MAINVFRNITADLTTVDTVLYTAPLAYSGIVLMAQISNTTTGVVAASMYVKDIDLSTLTSLITDFSIPGNDALGALTGKLVLQSGQSVVASAGANGSLQIVLSILESQN